MHTSRGACFCTHWDSLVANRNNDYMFHWKRDVLDDEMNAVLDDCGDPVEERKWYAITWDLDNTLWDDPSSSNEVRNPNTDWFSNYIYEPAEKDNKKINLIETVLNSGRKSITDVYEHQLREILREYYVSTAIVVVVEDRRFSKTYTLILLCIRRRGLKYQL